MIDAYRVNHNVTCYGYSISIPRKGRFDVERARAQEIPQKFWSRLQKGETIEEEGRTLTPDMVLGGDRKGIKVSYCTDTRPLPVIAEYAKDADLFICEGMYGEDGKEAKAREYKHMTFQEAAHLAKEAQPKEMWLTHYSPSLIRPDDYMDKVRGDLPESERPPVMAGRQSWDLMRSKGDADGRKERKYRRKEGRERMEMSVSGALERELGKAPVSGAEISVHDTENGHPSEDVYILAIESSCDETAASVVKNGRTVLSNIISSQIDLHTLFGGVVPEIASRKHIEKINQVIEEALTEAHMSLEEMTAIAVTYGPGLVGALLVGVAEAKALAYAAKKPLVGVHHIEGHISANFIENPDLEPPFMCLIVSGGHTHLVIVKDYGEFEILGRTRDDAAGEAFDKVARAVGLGYPGGPKVDKAAKEGNPHAIEFPRAKVGDNPYDFSFSGLKSAVLNYINHAKMMGEEIHVPDLAASFQNAVVEVLVSRTIEAAKQHGYKRVAIAGGVASNSALRAGMEKACKEAGIQFFHPSPIFCTDNAAMIGAAAYYEYKKGARAGWDLNAVPNLKLGER